MRTVVWVDGRVTPPDEARVPALDRGFLYGDSVYEVLWWHRGVPIQAADHLARLRESARRIYMEVAGPDARWLGILREAVAASGAGASEDAYVRLVVTRGAGPLVGRQLRYLIGSAHGWLGGLGFGAAALQLAARDRWIGWTVPQRRAQLHRVVGLGRFLIRPSVRCHNLASRVLRLALAALPKDFAARYGYRPWLVETFVDGARSRAPASGRRTGAAWGRPRGGRQDRAARGGDGQRHLPLPARARLPRPARAACGRGRGRGAGGGGRRGGAGAGRAARGCAPRAAAWCRVPARKPRGRGARSPASRRGLAGRERLLPADRPPGRHGGDHGGHPAAPPGADDPADAGPAAGALCPRRDRIWTTRAGRLCGARRDRHQPDWRAEPGAALH
jgi:hypothetical protein